MPYIQGLFSKVCNFHKIEKCCYAYSPVTNLRDDLIVALMDAAGSEIARSGK